MSDLILLDLDETLIKGDSAALWIEFCVKKGLLDKEAINKTQAFHALYNEGRLKMADFMHFFLSSIKNRSENEVENLVDEFIKAFIKPYEKALELIKKLKQENKRLIIISATADFLVSKIAKSLEINESIAIITERENGHFTGKTKGVFSFREGKIARLKEYLGDHFGILIKNASFYTDSINDLFLLELVKNPVVCNADEALRKIALERNYEILNF